MCAKCLSGIVPALVTPLTSSGEHVDEGAAAHLVDFLIDKGVHGLYALGTTGEFAYLDANSRRRMAEIVVRQARGKVPVVIHAGAHTPDETTALIAHAESIGADGVALIPPAYYALDDQALEQFFSRIAEATHIPLYLYNIPMNARNNITATLFARLAATYPHIAGMKESSMKFENFYELVQVKQSRHAAIMGNDEQILPALAVGGQGAVSAGATAIPEPYVNLYRSFVRGDLDEARMWQAVCAQIKRMFVKPYPIAPQKKVLELRGVAGSAVRPPLRRMSDAEIRELAEGYGKIMDIIESPGVRQS